MFLFGGKLSCKEFFDELDCHVKNYKNRKKYSTFLYCT